MQKDERRAGPDFNRFLATGGSSCRLPRANQCQSDDDSRAPARVHFEPCALRARFIGDNERENVMACDSAAPAG